MQVELFKHRFDLSGNTIRASVAATVHLLLSVINDIFIFDIYSNYFLMKIILFAALVIIWKKTFSLFAAIRQRDENALHFISNLAPLLIVNLAVAILVWPGNWIWDDITTQLYSMNLDIYYWQHFLTSVFYILAVMIIPLPLGVVSIVIVQVVLISVISAYVITVVQRNFRTKYLQYILYIPLFLPATIFLNLHPMRLTLYGYLDLLFIVLLIDSYRNKKLTGERFVALSAVAVLLSVWRTEGIYYAVLSPLLFIVMFRNIASARYKKLFAAVIVSATCLCSVLQNINLQSDYSVTAFLYPIVPLTERAYEENNTDFLDKVDKIYDVEILLEGARNGDTGELLYWSKPLVRSFSEADYSEFKKAYISACIEYFDTFISERMETFLSTTDSRLGANSEIKKVVEFYEDNPPLLPEVRNGILYGLSEKNSMMTIFWQPWLPILLMFTIAVGLFFIKKLAYSAILFLSGIKVLLVFITAPGIYFMYYFPTYLCGYFCVVFVFFYLILKIRKVNFK